MDWKAVVVENWPYKVAALALAVLLWFNVSANQDRIERSVSTPLEVDNHDPEWVVVDAPREVRTTFRGLLGDFYDLPVNRPVIHYTFEDVTDSVVALNLDPSMVQYDRQLNVQPVAVLPRRVTVRFQRVVEARVPVTIDLSASAADGFTIVGPPIVEPETVTVRGAESEVRSVSFLETEPISAGDLRGPTTRQLPVRLPSELGTLSVEPEQVLATLRVDSLVERRLRVRLRPVGAAASGVILEPDVVDVILRGPDSIVRDLTVREMSASVMVNELPKGERRLPVEVGLPEGVPVTAEASPAGVAVRPAPPAAPADTTPRAAPTPRDTTPGFATRRSRA